MKLRTCLQDETATSAPVTSEIARSYSPSRQDTALTTFDDSIDLLPKPVLYAKDLAPALDGGC